MLQRRWFQYSLRSLFVLMLVGAFVAWPFRAPEYRAAIVPVEIDVKGRDARLRATNASHNSLWWHGYQGQGRPFYSMEIDDKHVGSDIGAGNCLTGVRAQELKSGEAIEFEVNWLLYAADPRTVRIGISFHAEEDRRDEARLIWSQPFDVRAAQESLAKR